MNKQQLKDFLNTTSNGDTLEILFRGLETPSKFTVTNKRAGRGRGSNGVGVSVVTLLCPDESTMEISAAKYNDILYIAKEGCAGIGQMEESMDLREVPPNAAMAVQLETMFAPLLDATNLENFEIHLNSTDPTFSGCFKLLEVKRNRGKHGQIQLTLKNTANQTMIFRSHRNSGNITEATVVDNSIPL